MEFEEEGFFSVLAFLFTPLPNIENRRWVIFHANFLQELGLSDGPWEPGEPRCWLWGGPAQRCHVQHHAGQVAALRRRWSRTSATFAARWHFLLPSFWWSSFLLELDFYKNFHDKNIYINKHVRKELFYVNKKHFGAWSLRRRPKDL